MQNILRGKKPNIIINSQSGEKIRLRLIDTFMRGRNKASGLTLHRYADQVHA